MVENLGEVEQTREKHQNFGKPSRKENFDKFMEELVRSILWETSKEFKRGIAVQIQGDVPEEIQGRTLPNLITKAQRTDIQIHFKNCLRNTMII